MKRLVLSVALIGLSGFAAVALAQPHQRSKAELIADAISAAPPAIGRTATVMNMDAKGAMITLRQGSNGWTCIPDDPATPGDDPMCVDKNGAAWMQAMMAHKPPPPMLLGFAYMLRGGSDPSNLDPFATKPPPGAKWVTTGPHVMILNAHVASASGYPSGQAAPDTSRPYVMYGGTPYQHIMLPVR